MKQLITILVFILFGNSLFSQEATPCVEYKSTGFSIHDPISLPIFPGCESFKENHTLLNRCFGNKIAQLIADKLEMKIYSNTQNDNIEFYKVEVLIDVDFSGKLAMKLNEKKENSFEDLLEEKLNEISNEVVGIIPAKIAEGYCTSFKYKLPISFDLSETKYEQLTTIKDL